MSNWQPIETAPKNGDDLLLYREDAGVFLGRWIAPIEFLNEHDLVLHRLDDEDAAQTADWFYSDFVHGGRCDEPPTHWMPLPAPPEPL